MNLTTSIMLLLAVGFGDPSGSGAILAPSPGQPKPDAEAREEELPDNLDKAEITEHLKAQVPLDLSFRDESGNPVILGDYIDGERPVILNLGYFGCPMLCGLVANAMCDTLQEMDMTLGEDYDILTISIDPRDGPKLAKLKKQNYAKEYEFARRDGWTFLTGEEPQISRLAQTVGFGYKYAEDRQEYMHAAGLIILTPDGRVSRYLYGVLFEPRDMRLALIEAAEGKVGSVVDRITLYCYHYDADAGRYAPVARRIMSLGGAVTVLVVGLALFVFWRREKRRGANEESLQAEATKPGMET